MALKVKHKIMLQAKPVITNDTELQPVVTKDTKLPVQDTDPEAGIKYTDVHHPSDVD